MCRHFVPNLTFGAPMVKCLRKKIPKAFFGECKLSIFLTLSIDQTNNNFFNTVPQIYT